MVGAATGTAAATGLGAAAIGMAATIMDTAPDGAGVQRQRGSLLERQLAQPQRRLTTVMAMRQDTAAPTAIITTADIATRINGSGFLTLMTGTASVGGLLNSARIMLSPIRQDVHGAVAAPRAHEALALSDRRKFDAVVEIERREHERLGVLAVGAAARGRALREQSD